MKKKIFVESDEEKENKRKLSTELLLVEPINA